jgi:hypothetical protein
LTARGDRLRLFVMSSAKDDRPQETYGRETFNPWTVVNLVFHHLADNGLHPVLGETGDPAVPATALLLSMGIEPGRNDENVTSAVVQDELAALRARYLGEE